MISVDQAIKILRDQSFTLKEEVISIYRCINRIAYSDVYAPFDVPSYDKSMMDGYAFIFADYHTGKPLKVIDEIQAGTPKVPVLKSGEAARVFTGAPLPSGADTVVPQEDVSLDNGYLHFLKPVRHGMNIALTGTQTQKGSKIVAQGTKLTAEYIGFLATFGIHELKVHTLPKVGIITTGKELVKIGHVAKSYQTYDSNSVFLSVALGRLGITPTFIEWVDDDKEQLRSIIHDKLESVDIVLFTGGVSVGDYDFVKPVVEELGAVELFYKVRQKPGKPFYAGKIHEKIVFGLPGNPGSVVVCYHVYVRPFLLLMSGYDQFEKQHSTYLLKNDYLKKSNLTHFVKAYFENDTVEILPQQMSYQMDAYAKANCLAILPEGQEEFLSGQRIEVIKFK